MTTKNHVLQFTTVGISRVNNADNQGLKGKIRYIGLGDQIYTPSIHDENLKNECARAQVAQWEDVGNGQIRVIAVCDEKKRFPVHELCVYVQEDGSDELTVLCLTSSADEIDYKTENNQLLVAVVLDLSPIGVDKIEIVNGVDNVNVLMLEPFLQMTLAHIKNCTSQLETLYLQFDEEEDFPRVAE